MVVFEICKKCDKFIFQITKENLILAQCLFMLENKNESVKDLVSDYTDAIHKNHNGLTLLKIRIPKTCPYKMEHELIVNNVNHE